MFVSLCNLVCVGMGGHVFNWLKHAEFVEFVESVSLSIIIICIFEGSCVCVFTLGTVVWGLPGLCFLFPCRRNRRQKCQVASNGPLIPVRGWWWSAEVFTLLRDRIA